MKRILLTGIISTFLFTGTATELPADTLKKSYMTGLRIHYGTILPHSEKIRALAFNHPRGFEINLNRLNYSDNAVRQLNCYSYTGIAINFFDFDHPKIGHSVNSFFYFEPLFRFRNRFSYSLRAGTGISYLSETYDEINNPENKFFSSHIAFLLILDLKIKYKTGNKLELIASACYNHISNGGIKQPNYGMNFPTLSLGADYSFNPVELKPIVKEKLKPEEKNWNFIIESFASVKVQEKTDNFPEKACFMIGLSSHTGRKLSRLSGINFGIDIFADGYIREAIERTGGNTDYKRSGFFGGHQFILGKVSFTTNFGIYIYAPNKAKSQVYQKYLLQYHWPGRLNCGFFMIAHGDAAETMGVNFGFRLIN
jgi:hypothetical protein